MVIQFWQQTKQNDIKLHELPKPLAVVVEILLMDWFFLTVGEFFNKHTPKTVSRNNCGVVSINWYINQVLLTIVANVKSLSAIKYIAKSMNISAKIQVLATK